MINAYKHVVKARTKSGLKVIHSDLRDSLEPDDTIIHTMASEMKQASTLRHPPIEALVYYVNGEIEAMETAYFYAQERLENERRERERQAEKKVKSLAPRVGDKLKDAPRRKTVKA